MTRGRTPVSYSPYTGLPGWLGAPLKPAPTVETCCCFVLPRHSAIHPGVVAACEEAAVAAQRAVLREAGLPADEVEARVVVAATAHTLVGFRCGAMRVAWHSLRCSLCAQTD